MPTFDTPEPISVTLELSVGDVHLIASDRDDTVVAVNPSDRSRPADTDAAERTTVELDADRLVVRAPRPRGLGRVVGPSNRSGSVDIVIELPTGSHLHSDAGLGDVRADGRFGDVRVKTDAGHLHLDETGELDLATSAGNVTVRHAAGDARIKAAGEIDVRRIDGGAIVRNLNGATRLGEVTGEVRVRSANGDITIERAWAGVAAKTASGSIHVDEVVRGSVTLETASGGLEVGIREGTAAWVDARSGFGRVHNALDAADGPDTSGETTEIRARTSYGDITLHRKEAS